MAYREVSDDALERQLLRQQARLAPAGALPDAGASPSPTNTTQPVGSPSPLATDAAPSPTPPAGTDAGGSTTSPLAPTAGGALARYGTGNISGAEGTTWGDTSRLSGFNTNEWGKNSPDYHEHTIKNTSGKIFSRYDPTAPDAVSKVLADPDFKARFPEAKLVPGGKNDLIDFGDGNPVDVIQNAGSAEARWAWQPQNEAGGADAGGGAGGLYDTGGVNVGGVMGGDPLAQITAEIDRITGGGGGDEQSLIQKILRGEVKV